MSNNLCISLLEEAGKLIAKNVKITITLDGWPAAVSCVGVSACVATAVVVKALNEGPRNFDRNLLE